MYTQFKIHDKCGVYYHSHYFYRQIFLLQKVDKPFLNFLTTDNNSLFFEKEHWFSQTWLNPILQNHCFILEAVPLWRVLKFSSYALWTKLSLAVLMTWYQNHIANFKASMEIGSSLNSDNTAMFVAPLFTPSKYLANLNCTLTGGKQ